MPAPSLIVVDDEPDLCELIADYLGRHGFSVRTASCGASMDACLAQQPADLLILDVNMPGENGTAIARRIRATSALPLLMLTSETGVVDRVAALELGVDDYVMKPFDLRELRARIRTILRRAASTAADVEGYPAPALAVQAPVAARHQVRFGTVLLDTQAHCLLRSDGTELPLTAMEYDMLQAFAENPNRVLSRDRLLDLANRGDRDPFDRSIDIRVTRLRRKIEADPSKPAVIRTVWGTGYMFVPPKATSNHV